MYQFSQRPKISTSLQATGLRITYVVTRSTYTLCKAWWISSFISRSVLFM